MKNIIAVWDHTNTSSKLLKKTNSVAKTFGGHVYLLVFITSLYQKRFDLKNDATLVEDIKRQVAENFDPTVKVKHNIIVDEDIARWVNNYCKTNKTDLIIKMGNRSETLFHTPVDWQLIRQVNCPLLITTAKEWKKKPKILATVDVDDKSLKQKSINKKVLTAANNAATKTQSQLHVVYNIAITKALTELDVIEPSEVITKKGEQAKKLLKECLDKNSVKDTVDHIVAGDVSETVPRLAKKIKVDLVVMGSVGRTGMKSVLLGNTAERVLHNLRTDVLIMKP